MKTSNISYILWGWPLLDGFDFLEVNMMEEGQAQPSMKGKSQVKSV